MGPDLRGRGKTMNAKSQLCTMEGWKEIKGLEVMARRTGSWNPTIFEMKARATAYVMEKKEWWSGYIVNGGKGAFVFRPDFKHCPS